MSLFEHVPYTNFHDLNLSWLLKFTNNVKGRLDEIDESVEAAQTAEAGAQAAEAGAEDAQTAAEAAAAQAEASAGNAGTYANNAATSAGQAANSAQQAATNATNAAGSASGAGQSATSAQQAATNAASSASAAGTSASAAAQSATNAGNSATTAQQAATNAGNSATAAQAAQTAAETAAAGVPSMANILDAALKQQLPLCFFTGGGSATVRSQATKPNINNLYEQYSGMVELVMPASNYWNDAYDDINVGGEYGTFRIWHPCSGAQAIPILIQQGQNTDRFVVYPAAQVGDYVDTDGNMHCFGRVWDIVNNDWAANGTNVGPLIWLIVPIFNSTFGDNQ